MLKRPITFKNLEKETITRDFYFNLTVPEVSELEYDVEGGMSSKWTRLVEDKNAGAMLREFKKLISAAYGERDPDGITFNKIHPVTGRPLGEKFLQTDAYAVLFLELLGVESDDNAFTEFLRGCVPAELLKEMPDQVKMPEQAEVIDLNAMTRQPAIEENTASKDEIRQRLLDMSQEDFDKEFGTDSNKWDPMVLQAAFRRKTLPQKV